MPIPSPLAFQPTALRNVAAGLVVGNPIGSGGTRAKALTAAELKAIVEASGIGYLPLSGGTLTGALSLGSNGLTCGAITVSGNVTLSGGNRIVDIGSTVLIQNASTNGFGVVGMGVQLAAGNYLGWSSTSNAQDSGNLFLYSGGAGIIQQRNGLNAQCFLLNKSYTSTTSQEALMLDAGKQISGKLGLYSYRGSSGGSNNPIQIGMLAADGTTFTGMVIDTTGQLTLPDNILAIRNTQRASGIAFSDGFVALQDNAGNNVVGARAAMLRVQLGMSIGFSNSANVAGGTIDVALSRLSTAVLGVTGGITATGSVIQVPPSSVTLATNGQFSIEMTSNTAGNLVYRGSDGTTRRMALTFS